MTALARGKDETRHEFPGGEVWLGDNLPLLRQIKSESVRLIYIDPPFNTGKRQSRKRIKTVHTNGGGVFYKHGRVNHSAKEYVNGMASTNGIESVWAVLKRGITGTFHNVSSKHLQRYVNEFAFRLNEGNRKIDTIEA